LDAAIAQTATNYAVNGVDASAAVLQPDLASVVVTHAGLTVGGDFVLTVRNLADRTGNALAAAVNRAFTHRPPTATNLLDLYALDEGTGTTTADGSANALGGGNGTLLSAADVPRWIEGRIGSALDFDGINDEIDVAPLELFLGTSCSVTFWTKTQARGRVDGTNNRNVHGVVGRSDPDTADEGVAVLFGYMDGNGQIVAKGGVTGAQVDSGVTISDDQWHHVAINRTELSGNITIFIDGIQRASVSSGAGVKTGPFDRIGVILNTESSALRWLGALDEVRFYTSTLAANDVVDMVNAPPVVTASATVSGALTANLTGGATDDGLPQPAALTWAWSVVSTPAGGSVTFGTASGTGATANSSATFTTGGDYVLRLTYDDGRLKCSQDVAVSLSKVAVTPSATPLVTTEAGGTATFNVVLTVQPTTDVVINVSTSDTTEGLVSCATATPPVNTPANSLVLTFTSTNWNSAQTVTVTGVDDPARDGNINYTILVSIDPASDPAFTGESTPDPACVNNDNDTPGITVTPTSLTTAEGAAPAQFTVVLDTQPSGNVVITVASSNTPQATVAPPTLTFDGTNWNTPQPVQVTAVDDTVIDFTQSATIVLDVDAAATADADYDVLNPADVSVSVLDNEAIPPPEEAWGNCGGNAAGTSGAGWMALLALAAALGLRRRS
ncbi:MAG TPA: LamG-like jellyroll fold domain-containing protein, partial [Planctomycetota bacterium]|nr:LamG-like jellyroll fold domain-containing protein [Planctomycetota bacterium]